METGTEKNVIIVRLYDGEELFPSLEKAASEAGFDSAVVLMGIGMLRDFTLGYFERGVYKKTDFSEPYELVSLQGSLAKCGEEMVVHLHGVCADPEHNAVGGHVFGGTVNGLAEITLVKLSSGKLYRELNPKTGLKELHIG